MKTKIDINQKLLESAKKILGHKTEEATIEAGLKLIILQNQKKIRSIRGKLIWKAT